MSMRGEKTMRKRIITRDEKDTSDAKVTWLNLDECAEVEVTSEEANYPIESALVPDESRGWKASGPGKQTIRLHFDHPQKVQRIWLNFLETDNERTQECVLRWSSDNGQSFKEIVRQQWNFSPPSTISEIEDYQVELQAVTLLELSITPDISGGNLPASLARLRLA
jgi:hypothetical protein